MPGKRQDVYKSNYRHPIPVCRQAGSRQKKMKIKLFLLSILFTQQTHAQHHAGSHHVLLRGTHSKKMLENSPALQKEFEQ